MIIGVTIKKEYDRLTRELNQEARHVEYIYTYTSQHANAKRMVGVDSRLLLKLLSHGLIRFDPKII